MFNTDNSSPFAPVWVVDENSTRSQKLSKSSAKEQTRTDSYKRVEQQQQQNIKVAARLVFKTNLELEITTIICRIL